MFNPGILELLDNLDEGITAIDANSRITFLNKKALKMENIDMQTAVGRHLLEVYPSLSNRTSTLLKVLNTGKPIFDNLQTFKNYKGENITTVNTTVPIRKNKKVIGAVEISKDITRVRKLTEEVVDLKSELISRKIIKRFAKRTDNTGGINVDQPRGLKNDDGLRSKGYTFMDIIGQNDEMLKLKTFALKAADSSSPVLIFGETGTGKELFVQAIHNSGNRKDKPFIAQNCAALPSALLEGILFGTVKGSFTGAEDRPGLFELADEGTLYLDELNSMPLDLQAKLLRVIQDGRIRRVGGLNEKAVDVRIIASTNIEPDICVKNGVIRNDLYYRLNVIGIRIPGLRNRKSDIPMMLDFFISKYNKKLNKRVKGATRNTMNRLLAYDWPGNVRELEHIIESIVNFKENGYIEEDDLPDNLKKDMNKSLEESMGEVEKNIISESLKLWDGNISKTASYLKIPRQTLQYKLKKYDL